MIIEWAYGAFTQLDRYIGLSFWRNYSTSTIVVVTPTFRTVTISAESRTIEIAAESRTVDISAETRTTGIED